MRPKSRLSLYKRSTRIQKANLRPSVKRFMTPETNIESKRFKSGTPKATPSRSFMKPKPDSLSRTLKSPLTPKRHTAHINREWIDTEEEMYLQEDYAWADTPKSTPSKSSKKLKVLSSSRKFKSPLTNKKRQTPQLDSGWIDTEEENYELFSDFKSTLKKYKTWREFEIFMKLVTKKCYPLDNIAFLLFLDTVKFFDCMSTTTMKYFPQTKLFWKAGYRLFHSKFLYFMGGPKTVGSDECLDEIDHRSPEYAKINFAVPSINTIDSFEILDGQIPKRMPTGILEPVLNSIANSVSDKRFMLCADAKKVTAGIDKVGGDVDLFGFEDGDSLAKRHTRLTTETNSIKTVIAHFQDHSTLDTSHVLDGMQETVTTIGRRVMEAREMKSRQEFGLNKFIGLGGEKWRESKYVYAISALHASIYQLNDLVKNALININNICQATSIIGGAVELVSKDSVVRKETQHNMVFLNPDYTTDIMEAKHLIQRTDYWFQMRKLASVTGSTLHDAVGLRGVPSQKKHIAKFTQPETEESEIPAVIRERMEYGTRNECHALATLADKIIPTFFPNCVFTEEGCYIVPGFTKDILMIVSPDGSIREGSPTGKVMAAVEVKCPFPKDGKHSLHYKLPQYYVCQCLAEMFVLDTDKLIYASWSPESTAVLEVTFDQRLFSVILELAKDIFDSSETPRRPKNSPARLKELKADIAQFVKNNVTFLAEVPSASMKESARQIGVSTSPYVVPIPTGVRDDILCSYDVNENAIAALNLGVETVELAYDLQRRKATEVMVWVLTHVDRDTKTEVPCSVPIAFGLKDYKLTSAAMRKATKFVIEKCHEKGIKICTVSTDGQWIQLMTRNGKGDPLTILMHQKDVWKKVQSMSKLEICKIIGDINKARDCAHIVEYEKKDGIIYVKSRATNASKIKTPTHLTTSSQREISNMEPIQSPEWMPEQLVTVLQESDRSINDVALSIDEDLSHSRSLNNIATDSSCHMHTGIDQDKESTLTSHSHNQDATANAFNTLPDLKAKVVNLSDGSKCNHNMLAAYVEKALTYSNTKHISKDDLVLMFGGEKSFTTLTHKELDLIVIAVLDFLKSTDSLRKSWKKDKKVSFLLNLINGVPTVHPKLRRSRNPPKLSSLCEKIIRSQKIPKHVLNVVYASCIYDQEYENWINSMPHIPLPDIDDNNGEKALPFWYSFPENLNNELLGKSIDCSHNLTHLRVRSCTTGIGDVSAAAWKAVSKENSTRLNAALVEDLIDKQSVPNARTNFSIEVEECMRRLGYLAAADLTRIIRNWYEACDAPGINAESRVKYLIAMRQFLLKGVNFGKFPPPTRYINKIPNVTFEGILIDIDTKIQLHSTTGPYNIRSVGSLAAETMVGVLQQLNPVSSVSIKARDVPSLVTNTVEVMTCKLNPERGFYMRTSKRSGVYPVHEADTCDQKTTSDLENDELDKTLIIRDHPFDQRRTAKRKIRFGTVSGPSAPSRGALPVRQYHRKDESKILPSKRLGLDIMEL